MSHQEKYTLTWHTYPDHLRDIMKDMMTSDSFTDVTLISDDKKQIKAHRNILSACSPVFKNILEMNSQNNHPIIYLRGIQYSEIESILQFIYLGEAKLFQERVDEFCLVAKNLEIRELRNWDDDDDINVEQNTRNEGNVNGENFQAEQNTINEMNVDTEGHASTEINTVLHQVRRKEIALIGSKFKCPECENSYADRRGVNRHIKAVHEGIKFTCNQCDRQFSHPINLTSHILSVHEGVKHACSQCDYEATTKGNLKIHTDSIHEGVRHACNQCGMQFTQPNSLKDHIQSVHEGVMFSCNQCKQQFNCEGNLRRHIRSMH